MNFNISSIAFTAFYIGPIFAISSAVVHAIHQFFFGQVFHNLSGNRALIPPCSYCPRSAIVPLFTTLAADSNFNPGYRSIHIVNLGYHRSLDYRTPVFENQFCRLLKEEPIELLSRQRITSLQFSNISFWKRNGNFTSIW